MREFESPSDVFGAPTVFVPESDTSSRLDRLARIEERWQEELTDEGALMLRLARKATLADISYREALEAASTEPIVRREIPQLFVKPQVEPLVFPSRPDRIYPSFATKNIPFGARLAEAFAHARLFWAPNTGR